MNVIDVSHLADQSGVTSYDQGRQSPANSLENPCDNRNDLPRVASRIKAAAIAKAGTNGRKTKIETKPDLLDA